MAIKNSNPESQISKSKATKTVEFKLPKDIFSVKPNMPLIHQAITGYLANQRQSSAHTKTRGEVSGGGRKPWRQKGTGRARHGSIRSPIWIGGGIVFGPTPEKNYKKTLPKKLRLMALAQALSDRYKNKKVIVTESLKLDQPKTKLAIGLAKKLGAQGKTLFVTGQLNQNMFQSTRNVPGFDSVTGLDLNALDILSHEYIIIEKPAVAVLMKRYGL